MIFCHILKSLVDRKKTGLLVVHGRQLVDQAAARLSRESVPHSYLMAGRKAEMGKPVYVCSIDTLRARRLAPAVDLVVIDEAHMACSDSYKWLLEQYPNAFILAVTATPYVTKSMRHFADDVVSPITIRELIEQGFLVPPRYVVPPSALDLNSVKITSTGDYDIGQLAELMGKPAIYGDIAEHWVRFAKDRPTVAFCPRVDKSKDLADYLQGHGIRAAHCDAETAEGERKRIIASLEAREIDVVCNVGILCTGIDIPPLSCIIMARPTKSLNLYIQQAGRGTRPFPGKSDFIILDHAKNVEEHGFITTEHEVFLDGIPKSKRSTTALVKVCPWCYAACAVGTSICPECDGQLRADPKPPEEVDAELRELTDADRHHIEILEFVKESKKIQKARGYKSGWVYFQVVSRYGEDVAGQYVKKRVVPEWVKRRGL